MQMPEKLKIADYLKQTLSGSVQKSYMLFDNEVIETGADRLYQVVRILKNECGFAMLLDISALDWIKHPRASEKTGRFELDYFFYNLQKNQRVQLKVVLTNNDHPEVDSIVGVYPIADWMERECYDMMGIIFRGHPNLKRLLMWEGFEGHPLRKDYPLARRQPIPIPDEIVT